MLRPAALVFFAWGPVFATQEAADEIVARSIQAYRENQTLARNYIFEWRQTQWTRQNPPKVIFDRTWLCVPLEGSLYRVRIRENGEPLPPGRQKQEMLRLRREAKKRRRESAAELARRIEATPRQAPSQATGRKGKPCVS